MQVSQRYLPTLGRRIGGAGMILPRLFRAALGQRRIERVVELPAEPALGVRRANLDAGARPQPVIGVDAKDTADLIGAVDRGRGRHIARGRYADVQLRRSEEHTSELQSLMRISYAVFCLKKKKQQTNNTNPMYKAHYT